MVNLNSCTIASFNGDRVKLCLDSVSDSRCPANATCGWAGTAIAKFAFTVNTHTFLFTLYTLGTALMPSDTIVAGYKIKFLNLSPYPGTYIPPIPVNEIKAEVEIIKL